MNNNCSKCEFKRINSSSDLHCYMFKHEPEGECQQWRKEDGPRQTVRITQHGRSGDVITAALLVMALTRRKK